MNNEQLDKHLDTILRASGSALRNYSLQKPIDDMRAALRAALRADNSEMRGALQSMVDDFDGCYAEGEPAMIAARKALAQTGE